MRKKLEITDSTWSYGIYPRKDYKKDMLYTFYQYKDFQAVYNMGRFDIQDALVDQMYQDGLVALELEKEYMHQVYCFIEQMERYDSWPIEKIYGKIHQIRKQFISARGLEKEQRLQIERGCPFNPEDGIDQTQKKMELMEKGRAFIFALCQPGLFSLMREDMRQVLTRQAKVYVLVSESKGNGLPTKELIQDYFTGYPVEFLADEDYNMGLNLSSVAWEATLQQHIDRKEAVLMAYGEEGLFHCRRLRVDSIVHAIPYSYFARAMTNQMDGGRPSVVYVPPHFDITDWVKLTEKTLISYWQLARLWETYGNSVYHMTVEELYLAYPQYFINIYETGKNCAEAEASYPIRLKWPQDKSWKGPEVFPEYYSLRDNLISSYLNGREGLTYISTYYNEDMDELPIPWCSPFQQTGILVQGIRTERAGRSRVIRCQAPLRRQLEQKKDTLLILSNFLFFLTPKLGNLYNELRKDRPLEQTDGKPEHLDYMFYEKEKERVETFPLYHKACIAMKEDGNFLFFRYRLGGGNMTVGDYVILWDSRDVDRRDRCESPVLVYTPYYSRHDAGQESGNYRILIGAGRINLVIIQNRIVCIRDGDVVLPSIGVVVSLGRQAGKEFLDSVSPVYLDNGYYSCSKLKLSIHLDGPEQIPHDQWSQVRWAFGGGMSLILDGKSMFEGQDGSRFLEEEGWMSPLSRQTQETEIHKMARHPRTAVGTTKNGEFFVLVFSGRTLLSAGADYRQMCLIAKKLFPDVWCMMNVDGGGSSVLAVSVEGSFMELSYPATSMGSCAGMVRPINTVLCLEGGKEHDKIWDRRLEGHYR